MFRSQPLLAPLGLLAFALTGCGEAEDANTATERVTADVVSAEAPSLPEATDRTASAPVAEPLSAPKIAYVYRYAFRLPVDAIAPLQQRHADMCEEAGPATCRILSLKQSGEEGDYASGELTLAVAAPKARAFAGRLAKAAQGSGGEQTGAGIEGEDLSKEIVDTEARLRARTVLRDRLLEVLATRRGTVAELVEAERAVAQVNEEIDRARSWLAEMRGRVDYSRIVVDYHSGLPGSGGFMAPVRSAVGALAWILGATIAALLVVGAVALPVLGVVFTGRWIRRRWKRDEPVT